jgi:hypothetical protein
MPTLTPDEVKVFYDTLNPLILHANKRYALMSGLDTVEDMFKHSLVDFAPLCDRLFSSPEVLEEFMAKNPAGLDERHLNLAGSWRHAVHGEFIIMRHLKTHTLFILPGKTSAVYGVLGLTTPLEQMFPQPPVMVRTILIPFEGRIIYNAMMRPWAVTFGHGIREIFEDSYRRAKLAQGVIVSLPAGANAREPTKEERLRALLSSERSRRLHEEEIFELAGSDRALLAVYHKAMGETFARDHRRNLRGVGSGGGWYAVLEGTIVAAGRSEEDALRMVEAVVPEGKRDLVHVYQVRPPGGAPE